MAWIHVSLHDALLRGGTSFIPMNENSLAFCGPKSEVVRVHHASARMKCIITGGTGFVGRCLAKRLLEVGALRSTTGILHEIEEVVLTDTVALSDAEMDAAGLSDPRIVSLQDDIRTLDKLDKHIGALWSSNSPAVSVFHLSSIMSGQGEEDFDLCMGVNVDGIRRVVDLFRARGVAPKLVSASSIAALPARPIVGDSDKLSSATTYGMTKGFSEMFINDCSRKGFIDGRSARLPTIVPRPGAPNKAATGAFSSIIREPLHGRDFCCPISTDRPHPISGYRTLVEELIALHELPAQAILDSCVHNGEAIAPQGDRCVQLHATSATLQELQDAMHSVARDRSLDIGNVTFSIDSELDSLVGAMAPLAVDSQRATLLDLPADPPLTEIVEHYIEDFL